MPTHAQIITFSCSCVACTCLISGETDISYSEVYTPHTVMVLDCWKLLNHRGTLPHLRKPVCILGASLNFWVRQKPKELADFNQAGVAFSSDLHFWLNGLRYLRWGGDGEAVRPEK